jgi:hypothetical protein
VNLKDTGARLPRGFYRRGPDADAGQLDYTPSSVIVYAGLLPVARRAEHGRPLAAWLILRAADLPGRGAIALDDVKRILGPHMSKATLYRALADGERLGFWQRSADGSHLLLTGIERLCHAQDVTHIGTTGYVMPVATLGTIAGIRAAHYAALVSDRATNTAANDAAAQSLDALALARSHASEPGEIKQLDKLAGVFKSRIRRRGPVSQATLAELGAPTPRTQTRYRKSLWRLGIRRRLNALRTGRHAMSAAELRHVRQAVHPGCFTYGSLVVRPLPASYTTRLQPVHRSSVRQINRRIKPLATPGAGQERRRLFYFDAEQAEQAGHDGPRMLASKIARGGLRLWDLYQPAEPEPEPMPMPYVRYGPGFERLADGSLRLLAELVTS